MSSMLSCLVVIVCFAGLVLGASAALASLVWHGICRGAGADCLCRKAVFASLRAMNHRGLLLCGLSKLNKCLSQKERSVSEGRVSRVTLKAKRRFRVSRGKIVSSKMISKRVLIGVSISSEGQGPFSLFNEGFGQVASFGKTPESRVKRFFTRVEG